MLQRSCVGGQTITLSELEYLSAYPVLHSVLSCFQGLITDQKTTLFKLQYFISVSQSNRQDINQTTAHTINCIHFQKQVMLEWLIIWGQQYTVERIYIQKGKYISKVKRVNFLLTLCKILQQYWLVTTTGYNAKAIIIWYVFPSPNQDQHPISRVLYKQSNI